MIWKRADSLLWLTLLCFSTASLSQSSPDVQQQSAAHLREAHRLLTENKPAEAIPEFRAVVAIDPSNIDAHGNLGVLLFFQNNYTDAVPELRQALRMKPDLWKIQALLGMGERRMGEAAAARTDLEQSFPNLSETKIRIEAGMELIELYSTTEDLEKASAVISALRSLAPENQEVLYAAYRIHSDLAREAILSLSVVAPKSALMYQVMAHEAARRGDTAAAIQEYHKALEINSKLPGLHFELAEMLHSLPPTTEASAQAKSEYEAALRQNPFDEKAEIRLAKIAEDAGDQKKAYELYSRALALEPDDAEANYEFGKMLASMDQLEKAEKLLEHAVQIDPTNAVAHFRLSTVYRKLGRTTEARQEIEQYHKYKDIKDKLRETYRELHLDPHKIEMGDSSPDQ